MDVNVGASSSKSFDMAETRLMRKRRLDIGDTGPSEKVFVHCFDSPVNVCYLLNLSDEVLLEIFKFLDSISLDALSK